MIWACTETSSAETGSSATMKVGIDRDRARDADALALAAGELARIAVHEARRQPDLRAAGPRPARGALVAGARQPEHVERLGDDLARRVRRGLSEP